MLPWNRPYGTGTNSRTGGHEVIGVGRLGLVNSTFRSSDPAADEIGKAFAVLFHRDFPLLKARRIRPTLADFKQDRLTKCTVLLAQRLEIVKPRRVRDLRRLAPLT